MHLAHQSLRRQGLVYYDVLRKTAAILAVVLDTLTMNPIYREASSCRENLADVLVYRQDQVM